MTPETGAAVRRNLLASLLAVASVVLADCPVGAADVGPEPTAWGLDAVAWSDVGRTVDELTSVGEAARAAGERLAELEAQLALADALLAQGEIREAGAPLNRALLLANQLGRRDLRASALALRGRIELARGEDSSARATLEQARMLAEASASSEALIAAIETDLGALAVARGDVPAALKHFRASAALAHSAGRPAPEARALANLARVLESDGQDAAALDAVLASAALLDDRPASRDHVYLLINLATTLGRLAPRLADADPALAERAVSLLRLAAALATESRDARAESYAWGHLAEALREADRPRVALANNDRAVAAATRVDAPELAYRWQWQRARLLVAQGDRSAAIAAYRRALALSKGLRQRGAVGYQRAEFSFARDVAPAHLELVALLLEQEGPDAASEQARLREARDVVESSRAAELKDYFRDECVEEMEAARQSVDLTISRSVVVYTIILPDRLELLLTLPGGTLERHSTPIASADLAEEVSRFRTLLEKRTTRQYLRPAQSLYRTIMGPIEATLRKVEPETLVFVPDGPLRGIPMAALHDGERFLIERYATAMTPGIQLTDPAPIERKQLRALFAGLSESVGGFPALDYVPEELTEARAMVGGEILLDEQFVISKLDSYVERQPYNLIHIATHGQFMEDPEESFLLTWDGRLKLNRFGAELSRLRYRASPLDMLVLSACETAAGSERATLGLAGMAVRAGARSVVGTLWGVNDEATARLFTGFYQQIAKGDVSRAVALQRAQLALVQSTTHRHPGYWSAFLMIGSWL